MVQSTPLKVLIIEDSDDDAVLITEELRRGGYEPEFHRVEDAEGLIKAMCEEYDVIISDYSLPSFNAMDALAIFQDTGKDIPFIVVSGSVRESTIVDAMKAGARDYVMKENLTRLPLAVAREMEEAAERKRRRQLEEQLRHKQRLESLGVLAGGVAHDFNNLLTGILGNVSLAMEDSPQTARIRPMLEQALQATEQAANLTRQMLAYAGKGSFNLRPVNISAAVRDVGALLNASVSKNIQLVYELTDPLPAVEADRGQIQQLLMNLVINAAEAIGPEKPGTILLATSTQDVTEADLHKTIADDQAHAGKYVCVEVRDTGPGMEDSVLQKIFDPFFTTKFTGRGLGLSAVLGIVRSHHGALRVRSEPGKGTVFTVFVPSVDAPEEPVDRTSHNGHREHRGVVLVIDDEETIRRTAKSILENSGIHVLVAESARAGVEIFRQLSNRITLVLLDLTMPEVTGNEALRQIRAIRGDIPVILSSGYSQEEALLRVNGTKSVDFLQKPYTSAQLLQKVRSAFPVE